MDNSSLKHLPPYQSILYKNYTPSTTTMGASFEEFSLSSTNTNNNDCEASSLVSSSAGSSTHKQIGTNNFWFRRIRMNGQRLGANSSIPLMKNFWENEAEKERLEAEKCNQRHKLQRPFDFPKWRSSDAMSASLVASSNTREMIPIDSRLPQHRISKIHENESRAQETKKLIQQSAASERPIRRTNFNNTMCLSPEEFNKQQWYTPNQMNSLIENESIANMRETRNFFEQASRATDFENQLIPRPFVADRAVLSPVPLLNQNLSVQCQSENYSPNTQFSSPSQNSQHNAYNQNIYSQPQQQNGIGHNYAQQIQEQPKFDEQLINGRPMTFLEREILEVARREAEHQSQQQQLGHLTLEDTFALWRNGNDWNAAISRPQSSSGFHDHDSGVENMTTSSNN